MKKVLFSFMAVLFGMVTLIASAIHFVIAHAQEAFPIFGAPSNKHHITGGDELMDRQPRVNSSLWCLATNLYKSAGRTYTWQAGTVL